MAIINCPECDKEVSDKAKSCPNCGFGVFEFIERQQKIEQIHIEAEEEAYQYVVRKKKEEKEERALARKKEEDRKNGIYGQAIQKFNSNVSKDIEEAERLFLSILGWKESKVYVEQCKEKIENLKKIEKDIRDNIYKRNRRIRVIVILMVIIFIILGGVYKSIVVPKKNFENGIIALNKGNYEEADSFFKNAKQYSEDIQKIVLNKGYELVDNNDVNALEEYIMLLNEDSLNELKVYTYSILKDCCEKGDYYARYPLAYVLDIEEFQFLSDVSILTDIMKDTYLLNDVFFSNKTYMGIWRFEEIVNNGIYEFLPTEYKNRVDEIVEAFNKIQGAYCFDFLSEEFLYINDTRIYGGNDEFYWALKVYYDFVNKTIYVDEEIVDDKKVMLLSDGNIEMGNIKYKKIDIQELPVQFLDIINTSENN